MIPKIDDYKKLPPRSGRLEGGTRIRRSPGTKAENRTPLVSIITVVFNGQSHLEQTIQSVLSQTYDNKEYIIIDGGSSDGTLGIIKQYDEYLDYWMSEPDEGISDAFNKGLAAMTGEWALFLNSADTYLHADALQQLSNYFSEAKIVTGFAKYGRTTIPYRALNNSDPIRARATLSHQASVVHHSVFKEYGGFDTSFTMRMDYDFWLRVLPQVRFKFINEVFINYAAGGASNRNTKRFYLEEMRANKQNLGSYNICSIRKIKNAYFALTDWLTDRGRMHMMY